MNRKRKTKATQSKTGKAIRKQIAALSDRSLRTALDAIRDTLWNEKWKLEEAAAELEDIINEIDSRLEAQE